MIIISLISILTLLIGQGCQKAEVSEPVTEPTTTEQNVDEIGTDISDIGDIDKDLNMSDLDDLEKELDEINW